MMRCVPKRFWRRRLPLTIGFLSAGAIAAFIWWAATPSPPERFRRGVEAFRAGDLRALESEAAALTRSEGYKPHASLLRGASRLRRGRLREAVKLFGHATEHPDTRALAFALAGEALYGLRRPDDARRALFEAVRLDPKDVAARRWLAAAYYDLGLMNEALPHLREIAELAPEDPRPKRLEGLILKDFEQYEVAAAAYRESLRRSPKQAEAVDVSVELAECLVRSLRPDEALAVLKPAPPTPAVLALRAEAVRIQGGGEAARTLLARALEQDPDHARSLTLLGVMELEAGRAAEATALLEHAAEREPADVAIQHQLAQAYRLAGRDGDAERQIQRLMTIQNLRTRFTELHSQAMAMSGNADVRYELGRVAVELERPDLAAMWFQAALAIDPEHSAARETLATLTASGPRAGPAAARAY